MVEKKNKQNAFNAIAIISNRVSDQKVHDTYFKLKRKYPEMYKNWVKLADEIYK
jgi:hypothetical protein